MKRILILIVLCVVIIAGSITVVLLTSNKDNSSEKGIISVGGSTTYYEDGVFFTASGTKNGERICYFDKESGVTVPLCDKPDCTHSKVDSPDCNALYNGGGGFYRRGNYIYFLEDNMEKLTSNLIRCDLNGSNRKQIVEVDNFKLHGFLVWDVRYCDDTLLITYYSTLNFDSIPEGGGAVPQLEKYKTYVISINIDTGEVKNLVEKQYYDAQIWTAVIYKNKLYYTYSYNEEKYDPTIIRDQKTYHYDIYCKDLDTGDEKIISSEFEKMTMLKSGLDYFNPERVLCYTTTNGCFYYLNLATGKFTKFAENGESGTTFGDEEIFCYINSSECNEKSPCYNCYNWNTGETIKIYSSIYVLSAIIGDTVYLNYYDDQDEFCAGYISKKEFLNSNFTKVKFAYYVNIGDGI